MVLSLKELGTSLRKVTGKKGMQKVRAERKKPLLVAVVLLGVVVIVVIVAVLVWPSWKGAEGNPVIRGQVRVVRTPYGDVEVKFKDKSVTYEELKVLVEKVVKTATNSIDVIVIDTEGRYVVVLVRSADINATWCVTVYRLGSNVPIYAAAELREIAQGVASNSSVIAYGYIIDGEYLVIVATAKGYDDYGVLLNVAQQGYDVTESVLEYFGEKT